MPRSDWLVIWPAIYASAAFYATPWAKALPWAIALLVVLAVGRYRAKDRSGEQMSAHRPHPFQ